LDKTLYKQTNSYSKTTNKLLILLLSFSLLSCNSKDEVTLLFVGDILLERNVQEEYTTRKTFPWENLKQKFESADYVIGNLEGAVGNEEQQINKTHESPVFAIDSADIAMLHKAGFNSLIIENNHSLDLGIEGKTKTEKILVTNNLGAINFENSPQFIEIKNIILSVVAINLVPSRDSSKNELPSIEIRQKLRLAKKLSNLVVVYVHWGTELLTWPNSQQRQAAKWLIENGADLIIGCHPHVIQEPEIIEGKPVYFSLGNHLFDQKYPITKEGLIAEIKIKNGKVYCSGIKTKVQKNSFYPQLAENLNFNTEPFKYNKKLLTADEYTFKPVSIALSTKTIIQAYKSDKLAWSSHPMHLISITSTQFETDKTVLFTLEKYYSTLDKETNLRPYVYSFDKSGLFALWRGSALAWPMMDALLSPKDNKTLCVLHRGDSFIQLNYSNKSYRTAAYTWNGFGFSGLTDSISDYYCKDVFD